MKNRLLGNLCKAAAKELKNTRGVNPQWAEKADLLVVAYGMDAIEKDFAEWMESVRDSKPSNPVTDYLRIVDERMGEKPTVDENDPNVVNIVAQTYAKTGRPASKTAVRKLLDSYAACDIIEAWTHYTEGLENKELPYAVKNFFHDGGADGIILARRQKKAADAALAASVATSIETGVEARRAEADARKKRIDEEEKLAEKLGDSPF